MKVFYCPICKKYIPEAKTKVEIDVCVRFGDNKKMRAYENEDGDMWEDNDLDYTEKSFSHYCTEDDFSGKYPYGIHDGVEIREVDTCPHVWKDWLGETERRCEICGEIQKGKVVFE